MDKKSTATNVLLAVDFKINGFPITGAYEASSGSLIAHVKEIPLKQLLPKNIQSFVPELSVKDITALYRKNEEGKKIYRISAGLGSEINLSKLPLVGKVFASGNTFRIDKFEVSAGNTNPKLEISADIYIGGKKLPLELPLLQSKPKFDLKVEGDENTPEKSALASRASEEDEDEELEKRDGSAFWIKLNRDFGPVFLKRIGVKFENNTLTFIIDGKLSLGPLKVSMYGLYAGSPLDRFSPSFNLDGLGISLKVSSLSIAGAFLKDRTEKDSYAGTVTISLPGFSMAALGAYQEIDGHTSIFIFGVVNFGGGIGPPYLKVKGLAAGFGYNRQLKVPPATKVREFPLIATMLGTDPSNEQDPLEVLLKVKKYLPASVGDKFFALGITFTSYKIINGVALLTLSLGKENKIALLGLARMVYPKKDPKIPTIVQVELALAASYDFDEGILKIEAALTSESFLFSPDCRLMGGFAFYAWFKGSNAGDFVFTLGGYHPSYKAPSHYPRPARLGFHWQVMAGMSVKGSMYFALTPNAVMAGGRLEAYFKKNASASFDIGIAGADLRGSIDAYFIFDCNFLIQWKPVYYEANILIAIGIRASFVGTVRFGYGWLSYTKSVRKDFNLDLRAELFVRGPDFGGYAMVKWNIVSFKIKFGADPEKPKDLTWSEFEESFLPARNEISNLTVSAGLTKEINVGENLPKLKVINPADLDLAVSSQIPLKEIQIPKGSDARENISLNGTPIFIPSMGNKVVKQSSMTVSIFKGVSNVSNCFEIKPVENPIPTAQWNTEKSQDDRLKNMLVGCRIQPKSSKLPGETEKRPLSAFAYDSTYREKAFSWVEPLQKRKSKGMVKLETINSKKAVRNRLLNSMGIDTETIVLSEIEKDPTDAFLKIPVKLMAQK